MARFVARIIGKKGAETVEVDARDRQGAERILRRRGRILTIKRKVGIDLTPGMTPSERYTFMIRMSSMVGSKVGTAEALRLIATTFTGNIKRAAQGMVDRVEAGMDLPTAMEHDRKNFPLATTALVKAGAASGETWRALKDAGDFEHKMQTIRKSSSKEMLSATASFLVAGALIIGTNEYFGPQVMANDMFRSADGVDVGWITKTADVLTWIMIILMSLFGIMFWLGTIGRRIIPDAADAIILRIPYYKDLILARNNYVTLYKLSLLIRAGVRIEEAIQLTEEGSQAGALRSDLRRALIAVRSGQPWAAAMRTLHPTDRAALISSSDRQDIARTLDLLSSQYRDLYIHRITSFAPTLQVISALFMTLAGGILFGLTILPMLQLAASLSN